MTAYQVFLAYFGWPVGAVWSNLIASAICVGLAYLRLRAQQQRHHLAEIAHQKKLHEEMKAHVSASLVAPGRDATATAQAIQKILLDLKRRRGGAGLGF